RRACAARGAAAGATAGRRGRPGAAHRPADPADGYGTGGRRTRVCPLWTPPGRARAVPRGTAVGAAGGVDMGGLSAGAMAVAVATDPQFAPPIRPRLVAGLVVEPLPDGLLVEGTATRR